jgi:hypothetical protein
MLVFGKKTGAKPSTLCFYFLDFEVRMLVLRRTGAEQKPK